ncbi:MAG: hypothetical protein RL372_743 [Bacteroidota bacterium]|jgi:hypothetical protein
MKVILSLLFFIPFSVFCQGKLSYKPLNPKPGDDITITYTVPDSIFYTPDAFVVKYTNRRENLFVLPLLKRELQAIIEILK